MASEGAPSSICRAVSRSEPLQNGWRPASASQSSTPTAQTSAAGRAASPRSRSGEMYASVPGMSPTAVSVSCSCITARPKSKSFTLVSRAVREENVRRLDVAVDDAVRMGVREPIEDLRAGLEHGSVVERVLANRLAEGPARNVLVDDVYVPGVAGERVCAQAAPVTELRGGACLALRAGSGVAFAWDDLQGDLGAAFLLDSEPDRARAPGAEGPDRSVAPEHERSRGDCSGRSRHRHRPLWPCGLELLSHAVPAGQWVTVGRICALVSP